MAGMAQEHCWPTAALTGRDLCLKLVPRGMLGLGVGGVGWLKGMLGNVVAADPLQSTLGLVVSCSLRSPGMFTSDICT